MAAPKTGPKKPIPVRPLSQGLPEKELILDQVVYWCSMQATAAEIASSFYICVDTLDRKLKQHLGYGFAELYKRCEGSGKLSLRRFQFKQAEKNASMAIWLGKNWLGQRDHDERRDVPPNDANLNMLLEMIRENKELKDRMDQLFKELHGLKSKTTPIVPASEPSL